MVNELRRSKGLSTLSANPAAQQAAIYQANRMVKAQKMAHLIGITDSFLIRMKTATCPCLLQKTSPQVKTRSSGWSKPGSARRITWKTCSAIMAGLVLLSPMTARQRTVPIGRWCFAPDRGVFALYAS